MTPSPPDAPTRREAPPRRWGRTQRLGAPRDSEGDVRLGVGVEPPGSTDGRDRAPIGCVSASASSFTQDTPRTRPRCEQRAPDPETEVGGRDGGGVSTHSDSREA